MYDVVCWTFRRFIVDNLISILYSQNRWKNKDDSGSHSFYFGDVLSGTLPGSRYFGQCYFTADSPGREPLLPNFPTMTFNLILFTIVSPRVV